MGKFSYRKHTIVIKLTRNYGHSVKYKLIEIYKNTEPKGILAEMIHKVAFENPSSNILCVNVFFSASGPWCYITAERFGRRWEFCDVPKCGKYRVYRIKCDFFPL